MVSGMKTGRRRRCQTISLDHIDTSASASASAKVAAAHLSSSIDHIVTPSSLSPQTETSGVGASRSTRVQGPTVGKGIEKEITRKKGQNLPKWSKAGKSNRAKLPYNHTSGSRSFPVAMTAMAESTGEVLPDFCEFYEVCHTSKKTNDWIDPRCGELHREVLSVQDEASQSGTPITQEELSRRVLGEKKSYLRVFGIGPQPSSSISKAASRAHNQEMEALRSKIKALREECQRDRDEQMREREEEQRWREAQQAQIDQLKTMVAQLIRDWRWTHDNRVDLITNDVCSWI